MKSEQGFYSWNANAAELQRYDALLSTGLKLLQDELPEIDDGQCPWLRRPQVDTDVGTQRGIQASPSPPDITTAPHTLATTAHPCLDAGAATHL